MKKLLFLPLLTFLAAAASAADLSIISRSPRGQLNDYQSRSDINVSFNKPVAALGEMSQLALEDCPLTITPAVEGACRWAGTQLLTFSPKDGFKNATRYTVNVRAGLKSEVDGSALPKAQSWTFDTARPRVQSTQPYNNELWVSLYPKIGLAFNMPVNMALAKGFITLTQDGRAVAFDLTPISPDLYREMYKYQSYARENIVLLQPQNRLTPGKAYSVVVKKGMPAKEGALTQESDFAFTFHTYADFDVVLPVEEKCMPFTPALRFTNPVTAGEIYRNISFNPPIAFTPADESNSGGQTRLKDDSRQYVNETPLAAIKLQPSQRYEVTLNKDLTDVFGNKLGRDVTFYWDNMGYCPSIDFKGGFGILESYLKPYHHLSAVNAGEIEVQKQKIRYQDFIPSYNKQDLTGYCQRVNLTGDYTENVFTPNDTKDKAANSFIDLTQALGGEPGGIVLSQILNKFRGGQGRQCWQYAVDNVTNMGLTLKTSPDDILVWATYLQTGAPAKNKEVELRDTQNNVLWQGRTDSKGIARAPGWAKLEFYREDKWRSPEVWAFVKDGGNIALISSHWNDGIQPWRFNISYDWNAEAKKYKNFIFTERGVYRPGENVYIKSILREYKDGVLTYANLKDADFIIKDPRGKEAVNAKVPFNKETSSFAYEYAVPANAATGYWQISVKSDTLYFYDDFRVEAVKPAEFEVNLTPLAKEYSAGRQAEFLLDAKYLFGAALGGAAVRWNVVLSPALYRSPKHEGYAFGGGGAEQNKTLLTASTQLDEKGSGKLGVEIPDIDYNANIYVEAGVMSPQNQELFSRKSVSVYPADVLVGVKADNNMVDAGQPFTANIITINPQGDKVADVAVKGEIKRKEYLSARKTGVSGRLEWISEEKEERVQAFDLIAKDGSVNLEFVPAKGGSYFIDLTAQDAKGRRSKTTYSFYVSDDKNAYWKQADDDIVQLEADKKEYAPGQKAKILVKSPYATAQALITAERDGILYSKTQTIKGGSAYVTIPIEDNFAPNVFVSVVLEQGRSGENKFSQTGGDLGKPQAKFGYIMLKVMPLQNQIITLVETEKTDYRPGESVNVVVKTQNHKGRATPAEVVVFAVDEAMLALTAYKTPDIFNYFYAQTLLSVETADNRLFLIGQRNYGQKGENRGGGGAAEDAKLGGADLRSVIKFTPFYSASTITNKSGAAEFSFKLPDNLSKFRIMAVAAGEKAFGSADTTIEVSKPVAIKPVLPRFARAGDVFSCGFIVFNNTAEDLHINAAAQVTGGVQLEGAGAQNALNVAKGASAVVDARCKVVSQQAAQFKFSATSSKGSDGLLVSLPVLQVEQRQVLRTASFLDDKAQERVNKPQNMLAQGASVDIALASTAMLDVKGAVDYLINYPFNCLEQRMSKITPVIFAQEMLAALGMGDIAALKENAQKIIDEVAHYQTPSGGFAYWTFSAYADPYVTAYALDVLAAASKRGYKVDSDVTEKAAAWLNAYLSNPREATAYKYSAREDDAAKAYAVYALALNGKNAAGYFNNLYAAGLNALSARAKIYLLKAAAVMKMAGAQTALQEDILGRVSQTNTTAYLEETGGNQWIYSSNIYLTAAFMEAALGATGGFANDNKMAAWLSGKLNRQGHFGNTTNNAAAFRALNAYFTAYETAEPDFKAALSTAGQPLFDAAFKGRKETSKTRAFTFDEFFKNNAGVLLDLVKTGTGRAYYNVALNYYPQEFKTPVSAGFDVEKQITPLYQTEGGLQAGQRAVVTIKVTTNDDRTFVVLEDFLPAGFDIVDTSLATEGDMDSAALSGERQSSYRFSRSEKYDERIVAYADYLPQGTTIFSYIISASNAGAYSVPSANVSLMYEPEVFGRTASSAVNVK
ncbi:MAG: Ig-like domain-containing protein [Elusimicrobiota bacterium]|jgi:uncharacterized protein YfaS (alpha-2-macroglobulin family)|nr:Ig-like domain-containing protein [Elusimicrobiota bacterium]